MPLTIIDLFDTQVRKKPHEIALISDGKELTYSQLNDSVNQTIRFINKHYTLETGAKVAFSFSQKPFKILSTIMAVLKSGALYIPIDPTNPKERTDYLLEQSKPNVIITDSDSLALFEGKGVPIIVLDDELVAEESTEAVSTPTIQLEGIAYLIFTSGSTGNPKGVRVTHGNLVAAYKAWEESYNLKDIRCHLQVVGYGFDVFSGDWIRSLCSGSKLVMCSEKEATDIVKLYDIITEHQVECAEFLPLALRRLVSYCEHNQLNLHSFKLLICGSDRWYVEEYFNFKKLLSDGARLINSYGTSETTIDTSYFEFTKDNLFLRELVKQVPIGQAFPGMSILIVDEEGMRCEPGATGEVYIGGGGVSKGYINATLLNKQKFVTNKTLGSGTFYRTGDYGFTLPTGDIELVGRNDHQIKHKGHRVNISEIERSLVALSFIEECAIIIDEEKNSLVCYVTLAKKFSDMDGIIVREQSEIMLPSYLVPDDFRVLHIMPTNSNGKVDRKALHGINSL